MTTITWRDRLKAKFAEQTGGEEIESATAILSRLAEKGIEFSADGDRLKARGKTAALTPEDAAAVRSHKPLLLAWLSPKPELGKHGLGVREEWHCERDLLMRRAAACRFRRDRERMLELAAADVRTDAQMAAAWRELRELEIELDAANRLPASGFL